MRALNPATSVEPVIDLHAVPVDGTDLSVRTNGCHPAAPQRHLSYGSRPVYVSCHSTIGDSADVCPSSLAHRGGGSSSTSHRTSSVSVRPSAGTILARHGSSRFAGSAYRPCSR